MGHSVQVVRDRHVIFNDIDLMLVLLMMAEQVQQHQTSFAKLAPHATHWRRSVEQRAPGVIEPGLVTISEDSEAEKQLPLLLAEVESMVIAFGNAIPVEVQQARWPIPGLALHAPGPTAAVQGTLRDIRRLFATATHSAT